MRPTRVNLLVMESDHLTFKDQVYLVLLTSSHNWYHEILTIRLGETL